MNKETQFTILIVQQEEYERERMASLFDKPTIAVSRAGDGKEALDLIHETCPDILVTDLALDKMDGVALIAAAREVCPSLKVVLACAQCSPRLLTAAVELGVDGYVSLPLDAAKLKGAVARCAGDIASARRMEENDYSLKQLLDFFPVPALLADGVEVTHLNRRLAVFLGYADAGAMAQVDSGLEDFIVHIGDEPYDGHPTAWIRQIMEDAVDRDHIVHIENPRHPQSRPNVFSVSFERFPGSDLCLFSFQDISGLEDERAHLEDEAFTDPLTKALNRRALGERLSRLAVRERIFSLIMFDIDHFKAVNDTFGHDVGDAVLREMAQLVRDSVREGDVLARWGGEEFMVLCIDSSLQRARRMAERLRERVEGFSFTGVTHGVTSSFGVAEYDGRESVDGLVKRVDEALYEAKETGRNKVVAG